MILNSSPPMMHRTHNYNKTVSSEKNPRTGVTPTHQVNKKKPTSNKVGKAETHSQNKPAVWQLRMGHPNLKTYTRETSPPKHLALSN